MKNTPGSKRFIEFFSLSDLSGSGESNPVLIREALIRAWTRTHRSTSFSAMVADMQEYFDLNVTGKMPLEDFTKYFTLFIDELLFDPNDIDILANMISSDRTQK